MKSVDLKECHSKYYKFQFKSLKCLVIIHNLHFKFTIPNYNFSWLWHLKTSIPYKILVCSNIFNLNAKFTFEGMSFLYVDFNSCILKLRALILIQYSNLVENFNPKFQITVWILKGSFVSSKVCCKYSLNMHSFDLV